MSGRKIIAALDEALAIAKGEVPMEYRFVAPGGKATPWRPVPQEGISRATAQAKRKLGDKLALHLRPAVLRALSQQERAG